MVDQSRPVNPRMHYEVFTVTSSGCLKYVSQSMTIKSHAIFTAYYTFQSSLVHTRTALLKLMAARTQISGHHSSACF